MEDINAIIKWVSDRWVLISSLIANIIIFIKWIYTNRKVNKLGQASLAGKRYKELYVPLSIILHDVKTESFTTYKSNKNRLFKNFIKELGILILFKSNRRRISLKWNDLKNPILSGPTYDFPWKEPRLDDISEIFMKNRSIIPSTLEDRWLEVVSIYNERHYTSSDELDKKLAELIIYIRQITRETREYLEKKYPSIIADLPIEKNIR